MFYYEITSEGKIEETNAKLTNSAVLLDYEVEKLEKILVKYDSKQYQSAQVKMLCAISDLHEIMELDGTAYFRCSKAVIDGCFAMTARLGEPRYYVHVLPCDDESYLKIIDDKLVLLCIKEEDWGEQTRFTKAEIEEMKQDPRFKSIDFDNCLELVTE